MIHAVDNEMLAEAYERFKYNASIMTIKVIDDEFFSQADLTVSVPQEKLRWFCGTHDLQATFICQAL